VPPGGSASLHSENEEPSLNDHVLRPSVGQPLSPTTRCGDQERDSSQILLSSNDGDEVLPDDSSLSYTGMSPSKIKLYLV